MERITIVGGGSAGWITAFLLSSIRKNFHITLIESSEILPVGVGEGTTGRFLEIFNRDSLGIDLTSLLDDLKSLPKLGINFVNWSDGKDFMSPIGSSGTNISYIDYSTYYCHLNNIETSKVNETEYLAKNNLTNYTRNLYGQVTYNEFYPAVHVDAGSVIKYFRDRSISNGVEHIVDTVETVEKENSIIKNITLKSRGKYQSTFYIDCTGFKRQLMQDVDWIDYSHFLPIDRGMPFKIENDSETKHSYTNAIAMDSGWVWEIPTQCKNGRGYCYSSKYTDEETCLDELKKHYNCDVEKIKTIEFSSGRLSNALHGNCVAIGLAAAFYEPLQATSLHTTFQQIDELIFTFLSDGKIMLDPDSVYAYNQRCARMYDDARDFIFVHYTGGKTNTNFWKHFTKCDYPDKVSKMLHYHNTRLLRNYDVEAYHGSVGVDLWIPTLLGLGHFNSEVAKRVIHSDYTEQQMSNYVSTYSSEMVFKIKQNNYLSINQL